MEFSGDFFTAARLDEDSGGRPAGILWLFSQMMLIPIAVFSYGVELLAQALQETTRAANRGMEVVTNGPAEGYGSGDCNEDKQLSRKAALLEIPAPVTKAKENETATVSITKEENPSMSYDGGTRRDKDLQDEMLKLVRYKILFVKREYEYAFQEKECMVYDSMDPAAFAAWKVAEFIQQLQKGKTPVPDGWDFLDPQYINQDNCLIGLCDDDKKYLRVYYEVLERYPREKFKYEEEQIDILRDIAKSVAKSTTGSFSSSGGSGTGGSGAAASSSSGGSSTNRVTPGAPGGGLGTPGK